MSGSTDDRLDQIQHMLMQITIILQSFGRGRLEDRSDAQFKEEDHPRSPDGKFGSGGGGSGRETSFSKPLTSAETSELKQYGQGHSYNVSKYMRDPKAGNAEFKKNFGSRAAEAKKNMDKTIKSVRSAIDKSSLEQDTKLYRGVTDFSYVRSAVEGLKAGDEVKFNTFSSTSTNEKWADDFTKGGKGDKGKIVIEAKRGAKALNMDDYARFGSEEQEVLLSDTSSFKLKSYDPKTNTVTLTLD